jgi:hypothetical protein
MGRLSSHAMPTPRSNVPENLLERHPPQRREHPGAKMDTMEALTDLYKPTSLVWAPLAM